MKKVILYSAISLNGMIARANGKVDWLDDIDHPPGEDYGYSNFYKSIDITLMGNNTYKQVLGFGVEFPYKGKENYVFTRDSQLTSDENVTYISENIIEFVKQLKKEKGKDIWLVGGGSLNTALLNAQLIDQICLHTMPVILPDGIPLFSGSPIEQQFALESIRSFSSSVVESIYEFKKKT